MKNTNEMQIVFDSRSENEAFARVAVAGFITYLNPTLDEMADVKTAVSEAVTNAIIHGYDSEIQSVIIRCQVYGRTLKVEVEDRGKGIEDIDRAMEPMYTTRPDLDRAGMGFSFMTAFMDDVEVISSPGKGTLVRMCKTFQEGDLLWTIQSL